MNPSVIAAQRLINQQLVETEFKTPQEIVSWMGAMQAQDYNMARWGVGVRLKGITGKEVDEALNRGDIIRTHILRPTWHLVSRDDIHWMIQLSSPRVKSMIRSSDKKLDLTDKFIAKTNFIIGEELAKNPNRIRQELGDTLKQAGIELDNYRLNHIMYHAELDGVVCSGEIRGKKQTYCLLEDRVSRTGIADKDESLAKLAFKYFRSHGPATIQDFIWWSGLTTTEAKRAVELIKADFIFEQVESQVYIFHNSSVQNNLAGAILHLLPAFDELLVSYKDRKEVLHSDHHKKVITSNGIFRPAIFLDGKIIGTWQKLASKKHIETEFFSPEEKPTESLLEKSFADFNLFIQ